jgi:predicted nucleotide-binding protein
VPNLPPPAAEEVAPPLNMGIFVVHGDLSSAANTVTAFVEDLGIQLKPLPAAPDKGKGMVNSLEKNPDASFALMLLGQEDAVALRRSAADASAGVRSGIIFQLGYFVGRLGLKRVCVLYTGGAETFVSDHGVQFLPMDTGNGWQLLLARHLKRAGIEIDLNKLF